MANRMRLTNPRRPNDPSHTRKPRGIIGEAFSCIFEKGGTASTEREDIRQEREKEKEILSGKRLVVGRGPLAVWTTGVWENEAMGMRWFEKKVVQTIEKWSTPSEQETRDPSKFVRRVQPPENQPLLSQLWSRLTSA
jgi:phosphatidylglycerophosphatase GEP4